MRSFRSLYSNVDLDSAFHFNSDADPRGSGTPTLTSMLTYVEKSCPPDLELGALTKWLAS
jgi:hypothetical protein